MDAPAAEVTLSGDDVRRMTLRAQGFLGATSWHRSPAGVTAMLRRVEAVAPDSVIGRNTVTSIQSGLVWGFVAQVEGMVERMVAELGGWEKAEAEFEGGNLKVNAWLGVKVTPKVIAPLPIVANFTASRSSRAPRASWLIVTALRTRCETRTT